MELDELLELYRTALTGERVLKAI